jgi:hypothetical protein
MVFEKCFFFFFCTTENNSDTENVFCLTRKISSILVKFLFF